MEYRQLGGSGFKVPVLSLGTGTFGGGNEFFKAWGASDVAEATRLVDICLEAGAQHVRHGRRLLGRAWPRRSWARRSRAAATRCSSRPRRPSASGAGPNDVGSSRHHLIAAVEGSLRRLGTDYIDLYQLHGFDALTPVEETLGTLDDLVRAGKIRYIGCSNFSGWHLMKSLAVVRERYGWARYVAHQAYYSLVGRDYEWELMPLALDQRVGARGLEPARLGTADRQDPPRPAAAGGEPPASKVGADVGPPVADEYLYRVVDALDAVAAETGKTVPQIALNWLLQRPTVANVDHRRAQRGAAAPEPRRGRLEPDAGAGRAGSTPRARRTPAYPYWHQRQFAERNPPPA